jgi:hypothetical protein
VSCKNESAIHYPGGVLFLHRIIVNLVNGKSSQIKSLKEKSSNFEYWQSKPPIERLAAIE